MGKTCTRKIVAKGLAWAPEQLGADDKKCIIPALELCRHGADKGSKAGEYYVCHYQALAWGRAFGPLDLESTLRFCRGLDAKLKAIGPEGEPLVLGTPPGDSKYRANAAVLLGAYLILRLQWSAAAVVSCLGAAQADATFACSWARIDRPEPRRFLRVRHCWEGLELARRRRWISAEVLGDEETDRACRAHQDVLACYDCTWILPRMVMVGADPMTVVLDPNPNTCKRLLPREDEADIAEADTATGDSQDLEVGLEAQKAVAAVSETFERLASVDTVYKDYDKTVEGKGDPDCDFLTFLRQSGIGLVVKAAFDKEPGMSNQACGYKDGALEPYGVDQVSIQIEDRNGGIPKPSDVARLLGACDGLMKGLPGDSDAVFVHCKGGFGRSILLAACLAISRFDIPGAALLGWIHIVRPGAFTLSTQESFLASLKGRRDVLRYAKVAMSEEERGGVSISCGMPCQVQ